MKQGVDKDILKKKTDEKGYVFLIAHGSSMLPTIRDNDRVCISKAEKVSIGDVIGYFLDNGDCLDIIVIHRVVFVRETYVLARRDNNSFIDPIRIPISSILGVVTEHEV